MCFSAESDQEHQSLGSLYSIVIWLVVSMDVLGIPQGSIKIQTRTFP